MILGNVVVAAEHVLFDLGELLLQARRQNGQAHDLDQADVLLLDVLHIRVRVVDAVGELLGGLIVAQHQVELVFVALPACDRRDGVVRFAVGFGEHLRIGVGV